MKNKKLIITIVLIAVLLFFAFRAFAFRSVRFSDNAWAGALLDDPGCTDNSIKAKDPMMCGKVGFVFNDRHPFKVGDKVKVTQDDGTNKYYDGITKVVWVSDSAIIIDKGFGNSTGPEPGSIKKVL